ncbi:MAG: hypothetical protein V3T33_03360, partial [Myxococcota bacterium]
MSQHPLIDLAHGHEVKQAREFGQAAAGLTGQALAAHYRLELESAPSLHALDRKYLAGHSKRTPSDRRPGRDEEHLAMALLAHCQANGEGLVLPEGGTLQLLDHQVPLVAPPSGRDGHETDLHKGIGKVDLLGLGPENQLAIAKLKFVAPEATRCGTGDTPLRALLEGLAKAAIVEANRAALQAEIRERSDRALSEDPPMLLLIASPRYWRLCRKREAQKGAAWIKQMERLAREIGEEIGVQVRYLGLELRGDPGWSYTESGPVLDAPPTLAKAWERYAGRVRPKSPPRAKGSGSAAVEIEADLTRPIRSYMLSDTYTSGDRIEHPTLGTGVVQGGAGPGKIRVSFGSKKSLLVHERTA